MVARSLEVAGIRIRSRTAHFAIAIFMERWLLFCVVLLMAFLFGPSREEARPVDLMVY